ncbi:TlpA family protein disulfide reductase [Pseudoclavibacter endophyticus]|uniref:TlpA family protein disulfide reductase n=2 Tax=Pseudoclavibacter endophyticus TaxID=1778590 RepID=A0A6H9WHM7_9MICO|nr:TlpA family protein disulfide reductase [Pseudoclavibacter endophyticus]
MGGVLSVALVASLTACSGDDLGFTEQPPDGGQFAGDGSWGVFEPDQRGAAVEFSGETETGTTLGSAELAGDVAVVNFWYAACPPCRVEAEDLESVWQQYADDGVQFVGVNIYDQVATVESFNAQFGITYPSILDVSSGSVLAAFADNVPPQAIPSTLVLDRDGKVAAYILGIADPGVLGPMIDDVLAESST